MPVAGPAAGGVPPEAAAVAGPGEGELVFGLHAVQARLRDAPSSVTTLWIAEGRADRRTQVLVDLARAGGVTVRRVPRARLDQWCGDARHQGVAARTQAVPVRGERDLEEFLGSVGAPALLLVLDCVQDPHNLGACLRTAEGAGAQAVVIGRDRSAPVSAVARQAAAGAAERIPTFQVRNLRRALDTLKLHGIWLVGTAADAPGTVFEADLRGPVALVLGAEGSGMRRLTREGCDQLVSIPLAAGGVESLNVSVAAGVALFEAVRQRAGGQ